jgi:hypothetical protein
MPRLTDTVIIDGQPVKVVIYTPGGVSVNNLQELAEMAPRTGPHGLPRQVQSLPETGGACVGRTGGMFRVRSYRYSS